MKFYHFLKKNPEMNERITEARKNGIQTLIDKLLQVFQYQEIENPNQILWIREKTKFITFLANKLTDLYSDNKVQNVKTDQSIKISWEDNQSDLIDVSADTVIDTSDNKDLAFKIFMSVNLISSFKFCCCSCLFIYSTK